MDESQTGQTHVEQGATAQPKRRYAPPTLDQRQRLADVTAAPLVSPVNCLAF